MAIHVTAKRTGGPLRCEVQIGDHVITTDEPESLGGENLAPTPHELLPAALASCVASMIELYAQRHGWLLGEVEVRVDYGHDAAIRHEVRRLDVHIDVPAPITAEQRARLERVAETCPVRRAITADVVVEHHLTDGAAQVSHAA